MSDTPLFIHAGAHRTGTSSFQMCLHKNRAALTQAGFGLAFPGRDGIASGELALRLPGKIGVTRDDKMIRRARRMLADHAQGRPMILSEENIAGRMLHFMKGLFYPLAEERCHTLRAAWAGPVAHLVLVVRPYDALFVSGYRKRAEDNEVAPFDTLRAAYMGMDRGWPALVGIFRDVLAPEALTVIPYERRGTSLSLLERLVPGLPGDALVEPERTLNQSATDAGLEALQHAYKQGRSLGRAQWKAVIGAHSDDDAPRGFADFTTEEKSALSARYALDLKQIEGMAGVTMG